MNGLAVVGTGWISASFVEAVKLTQAFDVVSVFSRRESSAQGFANKLAIPEYETDWEAFCQKQAWQVVYLGTPNDTHFSLAKKLVEHGKHIIVEKPAFLNTKEWLEIHQLAEEKGVFIFEAARHYYEPAFQRLATLLKERYADIQGAFFSFAKYSSKYDDFLAGTIASSLSLEHGGGALMDLGVYPLYNAISWFGKPLSVQYHAQKLANGCDGNGVIHLQYEHFPVTILVGKMIQSQLPQEIYFGKQTLQFNATQQIIQAEWVEGSQRTTLFSETAEATHPLAAEAQAMAAMIQQGDLQSTDYRKAKQVSYTVAQVMEELRQTAGIIFPQEKE